MSETTCPRCHGARCRQIPEIFGGGWKWYCDDCGELFAVSATTYYYTNDRAQPDAGSAVFPRAERRMSEGPRDEASLSSCSENAGGRAAALDASPAPRLAQTAKQYAAERRETIMALRAICGEFGDLDWTDDLHLADIVNKHLAPYLHERRAAPADPERP